MDNIREIYQFFFMVGRRGLYLKSPMRRIQKKNKTVVKETISDEAIEKSDIIVVRYVTLQ